MGTIVILVVLMMLVWLIIQSSKNNNQNMPYNHTDDSDENFAQSIKYNSGNANNHRGRHDNIGITIGMSTNRSDNLRSYRSNSPKKIDIGISQRNITKPEHIKKFQYYTVIDFETTGLSPNDSEIIEIGAIKLHGDTLEPQNTFHSFVRPSKPISKKITSINNITNAMVDDAPHISKVISDLIDFIGNDCIIAHNAPFDMKFLASAAQSNSVPIKAKGYVCTLKMARALLPLENHKLPTVAKHFGVEYNPHRAVDDCVATGRVFGKMCNIIRQNGGENAR